MSLSDLVCSTCPLAEITSFFSTFMAYTCPWSTAFFLR
eukprot:CAMPEP_0181332236 /NCGR_PEP_ID=MMETSP1101-20121128/24973_1 /TAXON_ID=46948 /ORGANISM="Rhodomonas abbreviata, Strain Caron Lab Isolate" /LENGTH=37 /DNA_ID= /DNA_START= /DNA_END= /DNA_ORIENTATION=